MKIRKTRDSKFLQIKTNWLYCVGCTWKNKLVQTGPLVVLWWHGECLQFGALKPFSHWTWKSKANVTCQEALQIKHSHRIRTFVLLKSLCVDFLHIEPWVSNVWALHHVPPRHCCYTIGISWYNIKHVVNCLIVYSHSVQCEKTFWCWWTLPLQQAVTDSCFQSMPASVSYL